MLKKFLYIFSVLIMFLTISLTLPVNVSYYVDAKIGVSSEVCPDVIFSKIVNFLVPNNASSNTTTNKERQRVYVSGKPIGFSIEGGGVVVVTMGEIKKNGNYIESPCKKAGIKAGDVIVKAEGVDVTSGERLIDIVNTRNGQPVELVIMRGDEEKHISVIPEKDDLALSYRIGVWVRDNSVGVGTITYIADDGSFSALGHPVTDNDTQTIMPLGYGNIYKCSIVGVRKGERGKPGELKGLFLKNNNNIGEITENTENGIKGRFNSEENMNKYITSDLVEVAFKSEVKPGKAEILSTIDGTEPTAYEVEIIKTNHINSSGNRCMVIKIVDKQLLEKTNGIVQGMSGSPLLQDGKIVGCVTHVFINDPTKGFAEFIDK